MLLDYILLISAVLIMSSILIARLFDNLGVPTLLLFIGVGILAGSEGVGGITFSDTGLAQSIGIVSLVLILFAGGLDTHWHTSKPALAPALSLSSVGVVITAMVIAVAVHWLMGVSFLWGLLIGAIVSSTDAAAVFSILRAKNIGLQGRLRPLLELESGSNDPMAVLLTLGTIELLLNPGKPWWSLLIGFGVQLAIGAAAGFGFARGMLYVLGRFRFTIEGIYPVLVLAFCFVVYATAALSGGSGFLAVYITGIVVGNSQILYKKTIFRFFDSLAYLSQISMFVTLGLFVSPLQLRAVALPGLLLSAVLILAARPLSVFLALSPFGFSVKELLFISWVGLRGAVPVILATFPLLAGIGGSELIFNLVFFIVITSAMIQGWSIKPISSLLGVSAALHKKQLMPLEFTPQERSDIQVAEFIVPESAAITGQMIVEIPFPPESRVIMIVRQEEILVPKGDTVLLANDILSVLVPAAELPSIRKLFVPLKSK